MDKILMDVVVDCAMFFELSDDNTVNPDAATQILDDIAASLQKLSSSARSEFKSFLEERADREKKAGVSRKRIEFSQNFFEDMGLDDED